MTDQPEERETIFHNIVKAAADSPEQLRAGNIGHVLSMAEDRGLLSEFSTWLRTQPIPKRTRKRLNITLKEQLAEKARAAARAGPPA